MATGMEMMVRAFGIDPEQIKKNVAQFGEVMQNIDARLSRIEASQAEIIGLLKQRPQLENDHGEVGQQQRNGSTGL